MVDQSGSVALGKSPSRRFYGWPMLAALWLVLFTNLAFPMYGAGVLNAYMADSLGLDRKALGLAYSVYMLMVGLPGPLVAVAINRVGARATMVVGNLLVVGGSVGMATVVNSGLMATLLFGLVVGSGVCLGGLLAAQAVVTQWFHRRRALAIAIVLSANGVGGFVAAPLLDRIVVVTGEWRAGWWLIAGLCLAAALIAFLFVKERPADIGQSIDGLQPEAREAGSALAESSSAWTLAQMVRTRAFWAIALAASAYAGGLALVFAHGVPQMKALGHPASVGAMILGVIGIASLTGKTIVGIIGDRVDPRLAWIVALTGGACGLVAITVAKTVVGLLLFAGLFGIGLGAGLVAMTALTANYFGRRAFATASGLLLLLQTAAAAAVPICAGILYDRTGSYTTTFLAVACTTLLCVVLLIFTRAPPGESR